MPKKNKKSKPRTYSSLTEHKQQGKNLIPPLGQLGITIQSWYDHRLPEMLWAALLVTHLPRLKALDIFRLVAKYIETLNNKDYREITLSKMAQFPPEILTDLLGIIVADEACKLVLRPLLVFQDLPARANWQIVLGKNPTEDAWQTLKTTIARTLDHQSQESTDCRWLRVLCYLVSGNLKLPGEELVKEFLYYPNYGDMRQVRPSIRATEGGMGALENFNPDWSRQFWEQCLRDTECFPLPLQMSFHLVVGTNLEKVNSVNELLANHFNASLTTTSVDARHDAAFGAALFALAILKELLQVGVSHGILARLALRTITEITINIRYLALKDDEQLWEKFRRYGTSQAKLQHLKLDELDEPPYYTDSQTLHNLANEDVWQEFTTIELGHWANADLRKLSEEGGTKDLYDKYYGWTSNFSHGQWGSIRESVFDVCGNPLHRLHRIPRNQPRAFPDVIADACILVDKILDTLETLYPDFPHRVTIAM